MGGLSTILKDIFSVSDTKEKELVRRCIIVTVWFIATILIAIEIPNIGVVINILGSLAAIFIFVLPGVCLLQTSLMSDQSPLTLQTRCKLGLAMILGFFLFGLVLTQGVLVQFSPASEVVLLCTPK